MSDETLVEVTGDKSSVTVIGRGMLDITNTQELRRGLEWASGSADNVVLDLSAAEFIDTAVLEYIARSGKILLGRDKRLKVIVMNQSHPLRVLKIVGFGDLVDIEVVQPAGT